MWVYTVRLSVGPTLGFILNGGTIASGQIALMFQLAISECSNDGYNTQYCVYPR